MNTSRPSISRWNDAKTSPRRKSWVRACDAVHGIVSLACLLGSVFLPTLASLRESTAQQGSPPLKVLPPFLEEFQGHQIVISSKDVTFPTALGEATGRLARPESTEQLPAVLLIHDEAGLDPWMQQNTRDLAGIGFVALAVDLKKYVTPAGERMSLATTEKVLAELSAALRWLRRRPDVLPGQIGVVGWSWGGVQALNLAASSPVQACVICDCPVSTDAALRAGLGTTPVLGIFSGDKAIEKTLQSFQKTLTGPNKMFVFKDAARGFMQVHDLKVPARHDVGEAWVEIYEFLGKYVEDAAPATASATSPAEKPLATIKDIMLAVNEPIGVRRTLTKALEKKPASAEQWHWVKANAAMIAESARLLQAFTPPRGSAAHWHDHVRDFTASAADIVRAAEKQDYPAAQRGLDQLGKQCAGCHKHHR